MAYLDLHNSFATPGGDRAVVGTARAGDIAGMRGFSPLEWNVIALAKRDRLASLDRPGRLARALGGLFGQGTASRLADPRLETLRRIAVLAWHRGFALPLAEIDRFRAAGFDEAQLETLVFAITGLRAGR